MEESDLKKHFQREAKNGERGWRCPEDARLAAWVDEGLKAEAQKDIEEHVADCEFCLTQAAALIRLKDAPLSSVESQLMARAARIVEGPSRRAPGWWRWAVPLAAAACLVAVIVPSLRNGQTPAIPTEVAAPAPAAREVRKSLPALTTPELEFPREGATITTGGLEFRWNPVEGALNYRVRLMTVSGDVIGDYPAETAQLRIPLPPARKYYVSVIANLPQGKTVQSAPVGFDVAAAK
jgi:hypothetical protein